MTIYLDVGSFVFGVLGTIFFIGLLMAAVAGVEREAEKKR